MELPLYFGGNTRISTGISPNFTLELNINSTGFLQYFHQNTVEIPTGIPPNFTAGIQSHFCWISVVYLPKYGGISYKNIT